MQQIGRYQIRKETGRGGMSTVYEAFDPHFKRAVAVKVMTRELLEDPKLKARFEREAQTIAALEHPAIVPVYDFGEDENRPYLVMRLMTGGTLTERLSAGPMSVSESARILKRIGSALERAHEQGVIHRDLKPSNIMFDQYGDAFLADFGIARLTEGALNLTGENVIGTPAYMSPEQIHGDQAIDGRSDIYALGVICFEMLTGRRPFEEKTPIKIMMQHLIDPVPDIRKIRPDLPPGVEEIISRSMAKSPDERYSDAHELTDTLDSLAQIEPPPPLSKDVGKKAAAVATGPQLTDPPSAVVESGSQPTDPPSAVSEVELTLPDSSEMAGQAGTSEPPPLPAAQAVGPSDGQVVVEDGRNKRRIVVISAVAVLALILIAAFFLRDQILPAGDQPAAESESLTRGVEISTAPEDAAEDESDAPAETDIQPTIDALMERFYVAMDAEEYDTAETAVGEAIDLAPDQAWLYSEKASLLKENGDIDQALQALEEAIALEPENGDFQAALGTMLREQGDLDRALEYHQRGVDLSPENPYFHIELAETFMQMDDPGLALEHFNQAIALKDDEAWFYDGRANIYFLLGDYDMGLDDLQRASELEPDQRAFFTRAGDIFLNDLEDPQRAFDYYQQAVERSPADPWVYADRALAHSALGDPQEALADLNHAIELDPENGEFYIHRSQLQRYDFADPDAALADLNRAVEIDPQNPDFYAERANFFQYETGDLDAALADRNEALALDPEGPWRYGDLALLYREMGLEDEALANLDQCLAIDPHYYWCSWERAWVFDTLGEKGQAVENLQHFLELAPADDCPECHEEAERYIQENQ